jgi:hypothetical protein
VRHERELNFHLAALLHQVTQPPPVGRVILDAPL